MIRKLLILLLLSGFAIAQDEEPENAQRKANLAEVARQHEGHLKKYAGDKRYLVLPGLLADSKGRSVTLLAEATGLAGTETAEFYLIGEKSGHDYESLMISFASPGDVHKALEFIGMKPGRTVNYGRMMFWPKGERVFMTVNDTPIEQLLIDSETGKPLERRGLVFVGSMMVPDIENREKMVYAADASGPYSIASNYNEPFSVLDVPRNAPQSAVYRQYTVNPKHVMESGDMLTLKISPEYKEGTMRVKDLVLEAAPNGREGAGPDSLDFSLIDQDGKNINKGKDINGLLKAFVDLTGDGHDPFVSVKLADDITVNQAVGLAKILLSIESENGIRVEPPGEGQLYFKAFIPDESKRDRAARIGQPWEFRMKIEKESTNAVLTWVEQVWKDQEVYPDLLPADYPVDSPEAARALLDSEVRKETASALPLLADEKLREKFSRELNAMTNIQLWGREGEALRDRIDEHLEKLMKSDVFRMRAVFVFCHGDTRHGELMKYLTPLMTTHSMIHVYVDR